jgi:hypothetical protein
VTVDVTGGTPGPMNPGVSPGAAERRIPGLVHACSNIAAEAQTNSGHARSVAIMSWLLLQNAAGHGVLRSPEIAEQALGNMIDLRTRPAVRKRVTRGA